MRDWPASLGEFLRRRQDLVRLIQTTVLALYLLLMLGPVLLGPGNSLAEQLSSAALSLFWSLWWPGVILSMMLVGQVWCGLLCPDGTVTEAVSRHGRGLKPQAWMRREWLPLALFAVVTFASDAADAHATHRGTLVAVGSISLAALAMGLLYGRGRRIWCRYLCPAAGIFSLLSRCAVLHFKVDRAAWDAAVKPVPKPVECPLLLDVRRLVSNEKCNMCSRCHGHRGAVRLTFRWPGSEILSMTDTEVRLWEALGICFVLLGLGSAGARAHGDAWTIIRLALALGGVSTGGLWLTALGNVRKAARLAYGLIPFAGMSLFAAVLPPGLDCGSVHYIPLAGILWSGVLGWLMTAAWPKHRRWLARLMGSALLLGLLFIILSI